MELTQFIDGYCERTDMSYWSEPANAVTNAAFLIAAVVMWRRTRGQGLPLATALVVVLALIGIGSYLFHTHAQVWAAIADTTPITAWILLYVFAANRHFLNLSVPLAIGATLLFFPYTFATVTVFRALPFFEISSGYWPVPLLIGVYAWLLREKAPETSRGLAIGICILVVSLTFRSVDEAICPAFPLGTHFMWHLLNGLMLGWMIEVYRRHRTGGAPAGRGGSAGTGSGGFAATSGGGFAATSGGGFAAASGGGLAAASGGGLAAASGGGLAAASGGGVAAAGAGR